jgi:hypothetical protein
VIEREQFECYDGSEISMPEHAPSLNPDDQNEEGVFVNEGGMEGNAADEEAVRRMDKIAGFGPAKPTSEEIATHFDKINPELADAIRSGEANIEEITME